MPGSDVVKVPVVVLAPHALHVFGLFFSLGVLPDERRIAEDIGGAGGGWENLSPIEFEGVAVRDVCGDADRQALGGYTNSASQLPVSLVVDQEHSSFSDFGRPPVDFEAVELANGQLLLPRHVKSSVALQAL